MSSKKEAALRLPQLDVRFLADSNSWNVKGMLNFRAVCKAVAQTYCARAVFWQCYCTA